MRKTLIQLFTLSLTALLLVSCASRRPQNPQQNVFEVTGASVSGGRGSASELIEQLQRRLDASIAITKRGVPMRKVFLDVGILRSGLNRGLSESESTAQVQVIARDPATSEPVYLTEFDVRASAADPKLSAATLAESIAARIRYAFALSTPAPQSLAEYRPLSTVLRDDVTAPVVPAPVSSGDALLNANTRFTSSGEINIPPPANEFPPAPRPIAETSLRRTLQANGTSAAKEMNAGAVHRKTEGEPCVVTIENDCTAVSAN